METKTLYEYIKEKSNSNEKVFIIIDDGKDDTKEFYLNEIIDKLNKST